MSKSIALKLSMALLSVSACVGFPARISESDFEWRYAVLSDCDSLDIAGVYMNSGVPIKNGNESSALRTLRVNGVTIYADVAYLSVLLTGGEKTLDGASFEATSSDVAVGKRIDLSQTIRVNKEANKLVIEIMGGYGSVDARGSLVLDGARVGCQKDLLIIRSVLNHINPEGGYQSLMYSETVIRKRPDGSVEATRISTEKDRRLAVGRGFGVPVIDVRSWIFERADR